MDLNTLALLLSGSSLVVTVVLLIVTLAKKSGVSGDMRDLGEMLASAQRQVGGEQSKHLSELSGQLSLRQDALQNTVGTELKKVDERFHSFAMQSEQKLDAMRTTIENRLSALQEDNSKKLEAMRATVDEKLQKTLEERIGQSFKLVSDRLEQVYRGLGEMQTLAAGVGDLKKVLSNVKTRGVLGEIQLGAILEEILTPEQYYKNHKIREGAFVEYAVKMPGQDAEVVLPIDAKFPADAYAKLVEAYDLGDGTLVDLAGKELVQRVKGFAKDVRDKYIDVPRTTDFAILFLPFEGLYAEAVRRGLVEVLQRDYKVNIAGPTTMAALLNSLQMGFRTLAIQKHSGEVWNTLSEVKVEFQKFSEALTAAQSRIRQADRELEALVGTRTRAIERKLRDVSVLDVHRAPEIELVTGASPALSGEGDFAEE